jgi:hypothetical protein
MMAEPTCSVPDCSEIARWMLMPGHHCNLYPHLCLDHWQQFRARFAATANATYALIPLPPSELPPGPSRPHPHDPDQPLPSD